MISREFRYDSGRARHLNRRLDGAALMQNPPVYTPLTETCTNYDGDEPYGDFTFSGGQPANGDAYVPGAWRAVGGVPEYLHSDHLGTLRQTTSGTGVAGASRVFTGFGERITTGPIDRYGYIGAFGYQSHVEFPFLHVGARWYDPSSGRFLQRDPIGALGGLNVYAYMLNNPLIGIDPSGKGFWDGDNAFHEWVGENFWGSFFDGDSLAEMSDGAALAYAIGASVFLGAGGYFGATYGAAALSGQAGWVGLRVGVGRAGLHFTFGSGSAWFHFTGVQGFLYLSSIARSWGWLIVWLPARNPSAINSFQGTPYNCFTGALHNIWRAL